MDRTDEILDLLQQMKAAKKYYFASLKPSDLEKDLCVVYTITNKNTNEVLYVGRTTKLRRRLYTNHLMGNLSTARLKKYLIGDENIMEVDDEETAKTYLQNNCYFQYIEEPDARKRGQLEGLFSFLLNVRYIEKEH